jgi:pimeloyl-ACP methyl ester carboxylesterase
MPFVRWIVSERTFYQHFFLEHPSSHAYLSSHRSKDTAVVFVHGLGGQGIQTWGEFPMLVDELQRQYPEWRRCDLYFFGYDSKEGQPPLFAEEVRDFISTIFPIPTIQARVGTLLHSLRDNLSGYLRPQEYQHLVIAAHSMGGFIVRYFLRDIGKELQRGEHAEGSGEVATLRCADLRLFAPALFGLRAQGLAGLLLRDEFWFDFFRRVFGPSLSELVSDLSSQPMVRQLQMETEELALQYPDFAGFRASILWGTKEQYLRASRYLFDHRLEEAKKQTHCSVCKPRQADAEGPSREAMVVLRATFCGNLSKPSRYL